VVAEERTTVLVVNGAELPRMIHECPELTTVLVHVMLDRARVFTSSGLIDEKLASLGRLGRRAGARTEQPGVALDSLATVLTYVSAGIAVRRLVSDLNVAASRIHTLVTAVRGFTSLDEQGARQPIAIRRGLEDTVTVLGSKAKAKSVRIDIDVAENLPVVNGYGGELNQVWANLVDNAIDAAPGGHVRIRAAADGDHVVVRVVDDGPGIPEDVLSRIFDPFFTTKDVGEGTGLGLDIARRVVQRHRGAIFIFIGADVRVAGRPWGLDRDPLAFETSVPGIFAARDVRADANRRIAAAVGEGSAAIYSIHQYLRDV
jgi:signal transduction histidine kinase